jgi:hypothetical protein
MNRKSHPSPAAYPIPTPRVQAPAALHKPSGGVADGSLDFTLDYLAETNATAARLGNVYVGMLLSRSTNKLLQDVITSTRRALFWVRKKVGKEPACFVMAFLERYTYDGHTTATTTAHPCKCSFCQFWWQPAGYY